MTGLDELYSAHSDAIDAIVAQFTRSYQDLATRASSKLSTDLIRQLKVAGDTIIMTAHNQTILAGLDDRFQTLLDEDGYQKLMDDFAESFNGQFEWFNKVLANISGDLLYPLPAVTFTKGDMAQFDVQRISAKDLVSTAVDRAAGRAKMQALQAIGALTPKQLANQLVETLGASVSEAENLADTSISTFYRTITDKGFEIIEEDLPDFKIRYNYNGPLDKLNRPFCLKLERQSRAGKTWTRVEIDKMNNGQLPNVRTTCGGYRCRHQWMVSVADLRSQQSGQARSESKRRTPTRDSAEQEVSARRILHARQMQARLGVPHPHEQIAAIRSKAEQTIKLRRANV